MTIFLEVVCSLILLVCLIGAVALGTKALRSRNAPSVSVPAAAVPAGSAVILTLLGILAALGIKWAERRRRELRELRQR